MSPAGTESPVARVGDDDALVITMRELNQQAARIMKEIEETGRPAVITRDGRFIAVIRPLAPGQAESVVLPEIARQIAKQDHTLLARTGLGISEALSRAWGAWYTTAGFRILPGARGRATAARRYSSRS